MWAAKALTEPTTRRIQLQAAIQYRDGLMLALLAQSDRLGTA